MSSMLQIILVLYLVSQAWSLIDHTQYSTPTDVRTRDMMTHRGNRFVIDYDRTNPRYYFATQAFEGGVRTDANFAADFEDPKPGSFGWTVDASRVDGANIRGSHYNTFDYPLAGELVTASTVHFRTGTPCDVYVNGQKFVDGTHSAPSVGLGGVDVAVFNFLFIDKKEGISL